ncbi:MAG: hypothetical protein K1X51_02695 [Rhodospirillaceae bacterium]|nr:hypothetical protein [Rhodospirillaceae bacterium]
MTSDDRPTILCVTSEQFNRDVEALRLHGTRYKYEFISNKFLTDTQRAWVPEKLQIQGFYVNEHGPDVDEAWAKSKALGYEAIAFHRMQGANVVGVMCGNFDYWQEEGLRLACQKMDLPYLVLMREHDLTNIRRHNADISWGKMERIPAFTGMATAGPMTTDLMAECGWFDMTKIRNTGWPRHDVWRRPVSPVTERPPVVFMSYLKGYGATQHFLDVLLPLASELQDEFPGTPMVLKAKHWQEQEQLQEYVTRQKLNITVMDVLNLPSLVATARAVVGLNSAVLFECLLAPVPILIPRWGEAGTVSPDVQAPSPADSALRGHMRFVESREEMKQTLTHLITADAPPVLNMDERLDLFGRYFTYTRDRTCVERVEDFIDEFVGTKR